MNNNNNVQVAQPVSWVIPMSNRILTETQMVVNYLKNYRGSLYFTSNKINIEPTIKKNIRRLFPGFDVKKLGIQTIKSLDDKLKNQYLGKNNNDVDECLNNKIFVLARIRKTQTRIPNRKRVSVRVISVVEGNTLPVRQKRLLLRQMQNDIDSIPSVYRDDAIEIQPYCNSGSHGVVLTSGPSRLSHTKYCYYIRPQFMRYIHSNVNFNNNVTFRSKREYNEYKIQRQQLYNELINNQN